MKMGRYKSTSFWNIHFYGTLDDIVFLNDVKDGLNYVDSGKLLVFTKPLDMYSHECLYFLEHYCAYCIVPSLKNTDCFQFGQTFFSIEIEQGTGWLEVSDEWFPEKVCSHFVYNKKEDWVICGTHQGLEYLHAQKVPNVVIRMEAVGNCNNLESLLSYACTHFQLVYIRLYDLTEQVSDAFYTAVLSLEDQMKLIFKLQNRFRNISVVIPYVHSRNDLEQKKTSIRQEMDIRMIPMLEIPLMLYQFEKYAKEYSTFIVGIGDLYSMLSGYERMMMRDQEALLAFTADLLQIYVLPHCTENTELLITSYELYCRLKQANETGVRIFYLAKY